MGKYTKSKQHAHNSESDQGTMKSGEDKTEQGKKENGKNTMKNPGKDKKNASKIIVFSLIVVIFLSVIVYSIVSRKSNVSAETVAECLSEKGAVLYASQYCVHCQEQKKMFGSSLNKINMVECSTQVAECEKAGITAYPTWLIGGREFLGTKDMKTLYELAECTN